MYTITNNNETSIKKELPLSDTNILENVEISPKETITYVFNVNYNGFTEDTSNFYNANIIIEQNNSKTSLLD